MSGSLMKAAVELARGAPGGRIFREARAALDPGGEIPPEESAMAPMSSGTGSSLSGATGAPGTPVAARWPITPGVLVIDLADRRHPLRPNPRNDRDVEGH
jgi:hypothetical protein